MERKQVVFNFSRFYALWTKLEGADLELQRGLCLQFSEGETEELRLLTAREYRELCDSLDAMLGKNPNIEEQRRNIKRQRSGCLKLMQQLGVDTTDWDRVNDFCRQPRIAGKVLCRLSEGELTELRRKLEAMRLRHPATDGAGGDGAGGDGAGTVSTRGMQTVKIRIPKATSRLS